MSTWHQERNKGAIQLLWAPDPVNWKCVSDKHGEFASCMTFPDEASARAYAKVTGDHVIPPSNQGPSKT